MQFYNDLLSKFSDDLLDLNKKESFNRQNFISLIDEFDFQKPKFSLAWISAFLKRNGLSYRKGLFARWKRDPTYVKIFINQVASAVTIYGWNHTYNIDQTPIHINKSSLKTVAETGVENVIIDGIQKYFSFFSLINLKEQESKHALQSNLKSSTVESNHSNNLTSLMIFSYHNSYSRIK